MDLLEQLEREHQANLDFFERVNNIRRLEEECYNRRKHKMYMFLFRQAEKEYLDFMGIKGVDKQPNVEDCEQQLCFEGRKHQFVNLSE
jgi:hypothetical protein